MKRTHAVFAAVVFAVFACACGSSDGTRDGAATQQGLAPLPQQPTQAQRPQQSPQPSAGANLCRGRKSPLPAPAGFVSDPANILGPETEAQLESRLAELKKTSGVEFAVATVETTEGRDISDYSLDVACGWGVGPGEGEPGGGVLLLVAVKDRRWRIQVSRPLQATLPDEVVAGIGNRMAAHFGRGDFAAGISAAVEEHAARLATAAPKSAR